MTNVWHTPIEAPVMRTFLPLRDIFGRLSTNFQTIFSIALDRKAIYVFVITGPVYSRYSMSRSTASSCRYNNDPPHAEEQVPAGDLSGTAPGKRSRSAAGNCRDVFPLLCNISSQLSISRYYQFQDPVKLRGSLRHHLLRKDNSC